ncbi:alternate-type signal peptide domain-containing protein [Nocardioides sp. CN2-186]|uniref:alternate-type signal peptide domain-containing protein n=1 Tax=Nocardioides tweenelious TaxID=3156607 RepID=UPI0032B45A52
MRKSTKGTVAASVAALLLIGSWGTHASWSADGSVGGDAIKSGKLSLSNPSCGDWQITIKNLVTGVESLRDFVPATDLLSPGDLLSRTCTFTVSAAGVNLKAQLSASAPTYTNSNGLADALDASVEFVQGGVSSGSTATVVDGQVVTANVEVTLPDTGPGLDNLSQDLATTLNAITITASQV